MQLKFKDNNSRIEKENKRIAKLISDLDLFKYENNSFKAEIVNGLKDPNEFKSFISLKDKFYKYSFTTSSNTEYAVLEQFNVLDQNSYSYWLSNISIFTKYKKDKKIREAIIHNAKLLIFIIKNRQYIKNYAELLTEYWESYARLSLSIIRFGSFEIDSVLALTLMYNESKDTTRHLFVKMIEETTDNYSTKFQEIIVLQQMVNKILDGHPMII